ncbi:MAG: hypothetical protein JWL77_7035 [Chthonomonadaceae bacterium]|nr:hypothetical protein [Chthonomonadaceae bacterium]
MARRPALLLAAALAVIAAGWLGFRAYEAGSHLSGARTALSDARQALLQQQLDHARADIQTAQRDTASARSVTRDPLWRLVSHIPVLGRSFETVTALSRASDQLTHDTLSSGLAVAARLDPQKIRRADGSIDLAPLAQARTDLAQALRSAARAQRLAERAPGSLIAPPVANARRQFLDQVDKLTAALHSASTALQLAPALLGEDRTRRYFVAVQQNGESRGTGGLIGGYAVLLATHGRLHVERQGTDRDLFGDTRYVTPPAGLPTGYVAAYQDYDVFGNWSSINLPPDLPAVAKTISAKWQALTGEHLDGVIAVDGNGLQDLLTGSGPIDVGGGKTVRPEQLAEYLAVGQYEGVPLAPQAISSRKDRLEVVASTVLRRVTGSSGNSASLLHGLITAVRSSHLKMASNDPALAGLHSAGVDGALPSGSAPVAYPVIYNAQGSKLDHWLSRTLHWSCGSQGQVTVSVDLQNDLPAGALPPYVALDVRQQPKLTRTDVIHLDLFVTRGATLVSATLDGRLLPSARLTHGVVGGLPFWGTDVELPEKQKHTFALVLNRAEARGSVRTPEQPLTLPLQRKVQTC